MDSRHTHSSRLSQTGLEPASFAPRRTRVPGLIGAGVIALAVGAMAFTSFYRPSDVSATPASAQAPAAPLTAATEDAGITAAVKTALSADPALASLDIDVETHQGVVHLDGPAPDEQARQRAALLASAPHGVVSVENRLVVSQPTQVN